MLPFLSFKKVIFGNGVSVIEDQKTGRFCLINAANVPIDCYRVFRPEHRFLLKLFDGVSMRKLAKLAGKSIDEIADIVWTLDREGYFQNVPKYSDFSKRFLTTEPDTVRARLEMLVENESKRYKKDGRPWSNYGKNDQQIPALHVYTHLTNLCNLTCAYCFTVSNERMDKSLSTPSHMPRETIEKMLKSFCDLIRHRHGAGRLNLVLFGGEPTLKGDLRSTLYWTAERACEICHESRVFLHMAILSNGTQVDDELLEFVNKYGIGFSLSCDLPLDVQDRVRRFCGDKGSRTEMENAIGLLKKHKIFFGTRTTVTKLNQDRLVEAMDYAKSIGLHAVTTMPVDVTFPTNDDVQPPDSKVLCAEYLKAWRYGIELFRSSNYYMKMEPMNLVLQRIAGGGTFRGCGMGGQLVTVSTNGEVHSCFKLRVPEFRLANVNDSDFVKKMESISEEQKSQTFDDYFYSRPDSKKQLAKDFFPCSKCSVLIFCAGGCIARSILAFGTKKIGNGYFQDSFQLDHQRCKQTKELYTTMFWDYIDLSHEDKPTFKYYQTMVKIQPSFWYDPMSA